MHALANDYQRSRIRVPEPLLSGIDAKLHSFVGSYWKGGYNVVMELMQEAEKIYAMGEELRNVSRTELHRRVDYLRDSIKRRKKGHEEYIAEALAVIREVADRTVSLRAYKSQLAGALALYRGYIAEMAVGEGKTLTAAITAVLRGWIGLPCHIITVNDYLADRDARWMRPLYSFCRVSVGAVLGEMAPEQRREGHHCDVTYTTSKEIVADFLRDRLWLGRLQKPERRQITWLLGRNAEVESGLVMRGIHTAIVDEADNILIDEAVTPLIISKAVPNDAYVEACQYAGEIAESMTAGTDYRVNRKYKDIELTPASKEMIAGKVRQYTGKFRGVGGYLELVQQALNAREFFHRDEQYVIQDGKVVIVDEFTGRQMPQRTWRAGLHQFVEANEALEMTSPTETLARLSFQRFFRFFDELSGMTGTARESAQELWDIYELSVLEIPENRPCIRRVYQPRAFGDQEPKWCAIVAEIQRLHAQGRPLLVGTRSVKASENLAGRLEQMKLSYQLLNAVKHAEEANIVAMAGQYGSITIATNMAGRGTDIRLGKGVPEAGGLHVIATEAHESKRIDRQLFGRSGRQGDPGSAQLFFSMEDELIRRYVPKSVRTVVKRQLNLKLPGAQRAAMAVVRMAQEAAQRVAYKQRRSVLRMDTWLEDSLSFAYKEIV